MLRARWLLLFGVCSAIGALFVSAVNDLGWPKTVALALSPVLPPLIFLALYQGWGELKNLRKSLTWWQGAWLLAFVSTLVFRIRDSSSIQRSPIDGWALYRIGLVFLVTIILARRLRETGWLRFVNRGLPAALLAYAVLCLVSSAWSAYPAWTLYRSGEYLVDIALIAAIVASIHTPSECKSFFDWNWFLLLLLVGSVWLGTVLWPNEALLATGSILGRRIHGVIPAIDQDTVGEYGAILALVGMIRARAGSLERRSHVFYMAVGALGLITLVCTQARSAFVGFIIGALFVMWFMRRWKLALLLVAVAVLLTVFTNAPGIAWKIVQRGDNQQGLETMSGRLPRWQAGWQAFLDSPILGYGAYAGQRFVVGPKLHDRELADLLNTYLDVVVGTGIFGLVPVITVLVGVWWILLRFLRGPTTGLERQLAIEAIALLSVETSRSFFADRLISHTGFLIAIALAYAEFLRRRAAQPTLAAQTSERITSPVTFSELAPDPAF